MRRSERVAALLLALAASAPGAHGASGVLGAPVSAPRAARDEIDAIAAVHAKDKVLIQLLELQQRLRAGALPADADLALDRTTREQVLAGLDVRKALQLGLEPRRVRDRLHPGFVAEIELLDRQRARSDVGPLPEPSPLLTMILDLEQDLWREADRRRQRIGIKSPLDSGPLSQRLEAPSPAGAGPEGDGASATAAAGAPPDPANAAATHDPRLLGHAHYKAGRYADALAAWKDLPAPEGSAGLEFEYQRADCLMRTDRIADAIAAWEKLAAEHEGTSWAAQAKFALKVARAVQALRAAREERP